MRFIVVFSRGDGSSSSCIVVQPQLLLFDVSVQQSYEHKATSCQPRPRTTVPDRVLGPCGVIKGQRGSEVGRVQHHHIHTPPLLPPPPSCPFLAPRPLPRPGVPAATAQPPPGNRAFPLFLSRLTQSDSGNICSFPLTEFITLACVFCFGFFSKRFRFPVCVWRLPDFKL